jgi:deoxyribonuclease V
MARKCDFMSEGPDISRLVYKATSQIPAGMVSTYGDIAKALGDRAAARAVGEILSHNPTPIVVPCHRVVYSTGETGWYGGMGKGCERKKELLISEGLKVADGKVQELEKVRFRDFRVPPILQELRREQDEVRGKVVEDDRFGELVKVAGLDVAYDGDRAFGAMVVYDWHSGEFLEERTVEGEVRFPYIPTYLAFRELPVLRELVKREEGVVHLIDGHGVLHPRGAGIASHIGVALDIATVGAAKSLLVGTVQSPEKAHAPIVLGGRVKGCRLGAGKKATFVSTGHRVSLYTAVIVCSKFLKSGVPTPLGRAHMVANQSRQKAKGDGR